MQVMHTLRVDIVCVPVMRAKYFDTVHTRKRALAAGRVMLLREGGTNVLHEVCQGTTARPRLLTKEDWGKPCTVGMVINCIMHI